MNSLEARKMPCDLPTAVHVAEVTVSSMMKTCQLYKMHSQLNPDVVTQVEVNVINVILLVDIHCGEV